MAEDGRLPGDTGATSRQVYPHALVVPFATLFELLWMWPPCYA